MALRRRTIIAICVVGGLVVAGGVAVGVGSLNVAEDAKALAAARAAGAKLSDAQDAVVGARIAQDSAITAAVAEHARGSSLLAVTDPAFLGDPAARDALQLALTDVVDTAGLAVGADGAATVPEPTLPVRFSDAVIPKGRAAQLEAAETMTDELAPLRTDAADLSAAAREIGDSTAALADAESAVVASAHEKGVATPAPELASDETKGAFAVAVAALDTPAADADLAALVRAVEDGWAAALASHEAAVRARAVAAAQPTFVRGVLIVNKTYALPSTYGNGLTAETISAFDAMKAEAAALGLNLYIASGFRSYATQKSVYNSYVAKDGQAAADTYSARPGHSEHQSGLAFDLNSISEAFASTPEGTWTRDNAYRFGFIERFPQGKDAITGYKWEPWHLRYVGVAIATELHASGQTLEEYLGVTSRY